MFRKYFPTLCFVMTGCFSVLFSIHCSSELNLPAQETKGTQEVASRAERQQETLPGPEETYPDQQESMSSKPDSGREHLPEEKPNGDMTERQRESGSEPAEKINDTHTPKTPESIIFVKVFPKYIGTRGSKDKAEFTFQVLNATKTGVPAGTIVTFDIQPPNVATLSLKQAKTNAKGEVSTQVQSGKITSSIVITAKVNLPAQGANCPKSCSSNSDCGSCGNTCIKGICQSVLIAKTPPFPIVGGYPNHGGMSFICPNTNVPAMHGRRGSSISAKISSLCRVDLHDRFGHKVGLPTQVLFGIEAGTIDATRTTPGYPTSKMPGRVTVDLRTQNPPPLDVSPLTLPNVNNCLDTTCTAPAKGGYWLPYNCTTKYSAPRLYVEPWYLDSFGRVRNPRDGVVTVIAYTKGEESFTDLNKNDRYDKGEPFVDLGEPYIDSNENGKWDTKERYIDKPCTQAEVAQSKNGCTRIGVGNGIRDAPNGVWDKETLIWRHARILWTGPLKVFNSRTNVQGPIDVGSCKNVPFPHTISDMTTNRYQAPTLTVPFEVTPSQSPKFRTVFVDENLNPITPNSTVTYTSPHVRVSLNPASTQPYPGGLGFTLRLVQKAQASGGTIVSTHIVPSFFFGLNLTQSHILTLSDLNGSRATTASPATVNISVMSRGPGTTTIRNGLRLSGRTY